MLELTKQGFSREKAYKIVQKNALNSWRKNISFYDSLVRDKTIIKKISSDKLKKMFNYNHYIKKINIIYSRVFK